MRKSKIAILLIAFFAIGMGLTSCMSKSENSTKTDKTEQTDKKTDSEYACPMHPQITGVKGDKCSKCGMNLTDTKGDDHKGHNH